MIFICFFCDLQIDIAFLNVIITHIFIMVCTILETSNDTQEPSSLWDDIWTNNISGRCKWIAPLKYFAYLLELLL